MDYMHFLDEFDTYNEYNQLMKKNKEEDFMLGAMGQDHISFDNPKFIKPTGHQKDDRVNSPSHYTSGKTEAIDVIEDAVKTAPSVVDGMLQGQVLKYMLRVWLKDNPLEDMRKAQWYLTRLIKHYSDAPGNSIPGDWSAPFEKQ